MRFSADAAKPLQEQDGLTFGTSFTKRLPPATTTTSSQRFATILRWTTLEKTKRTEKLRAPATGLFLIYAIHTNPFITPRLAPVAANSPRVPPGRFSRYAIIALWAVSGQTWAFLLSHTHLRCPIKINAYFQLLYPLFTCYFSDPCCPQKSTFFLRFLTQLHLTKIAS